MYCLSSFCCVCLNEGAKLQDINQLDVDGLPFINKIIFVSFGHEAIDFKVVRHICNECTKILQLAYTFKRSCLMNHELLQIYSGQLKYFTGRVSEYRDLCVSVERLREKEETLKNTPGEQEPEENDENIDTLITTFSPKNLTANKKKQKLLKCTSCDIIFNGFNFLRTHYATKHKSMFKAVKTIDKSTKKTTITFKCVICSNKLCSIYSLIRHLQLHGAKKKEKRTCNFCDTLLENNEAYKTHLSTIHADRSSRRCHLCELTLESDFQFRRHMFLNHTPKKCKSCDETFFSNAELFAHAKTKHKMHNCETCDKSFVLLRNLLTHMKSHYPDTYEPAEPEPVLEPEPEPQPEPEPPIERTEHETENNTPETIPFTEPVKNRPLFWHLRKKCKNCLSIFSSAAALKKHKCFKLKNMFQCNNCFIIYSKKSSLGNHLKLCTTSRNVNTPELQEEEIQTNETQTNNENDANLSFIEPIVKDENELDIKEELIDDCISNSLQLKEKKLEISEVFSITEFPDFSEQPKEMKEKNTAEILEQNPIKIVQKTPKKKFPKIKLADKNETLPPPEDKLNTQENNETTVKPKRFSLRRKSGLFDETERLETLFTNPENTEFSDSDSSRPEVQNEIEVEVDPLLNFVDNEPNYISENNQITEMTQPSQNKTSQIKKRRMSTWVDEMHELNESFMVQDKNEPVKKRRLSVWPENTSNENSNDGNDNKSEPETKKTAATTKKRRSSVWAEATPNENSNESFNDKTETETNNPRRKSIYTESNNKLPEIIPNNPQLTVTKMRRESININTILDLNIPTESHNKQPEIIPNNSHLISDLNISTESNNKQPEIIPNNSQLTVTKTRRISINRDPIPDLSKVAALKPHLNENIEVKRKAEGDKLLPIILKTRRSIKNIKPRRKTICAETQQTPDNVKKIEGIMKKMEPSDVNKNIANKQNTSTIRVFKLRDVRRNSICADGQSSNIFNVINMEQNEIDSNFILVRNISDINNDVSDQSNP